MYAVTENCQKPVKLFISTKVTLKNIFAYSAMAIFLIEYKRTVSGLFRK